MHKHNYIYIEEKHTNPDPKLVVLKKESSLKKYLHEIKKLTHFGSIIMLRYLNKVYFHFTLHFESSSSHLNDY
jgi:hypothetical protein